MTSGKMDRRNFLRWSAVASAALAVPVLSGVPAWAEEFAFIDGYRTNVLANRTAETNAAVRVLSGMARLWRTGANWNDGSVLEPAVLRANVRHVVAVTRSRTQAEAKRAFLCDRRDQSYSAIGGLGPLADLYRSGAKAVTGILSAPEGTPPAKIDDAVPPTAPAGSALGAGSDSSDLGRVVRLVETLRGPYASGNPGKYAYQYPRPWRLTADSRVVDTGAIDVLGYPVYKSEVVVAPQLLRQRATSPVDDAGYPSGHTNAFHLACLALAYAVPERFQELVARAYDLSDTRIIAGMHSPLDVIGGRVLGTALAAATLADPVNAVLKSEARTQALAYFTAKTATTADTLYARAHTGPDEYSDRKANAALVAYRSTYGLPGGVSRTPLRVPKGAEVLLETRLPYLDAGQRREVLRSTAFPAGNAVLDGPEQWGRLNLFVAADGYGSFEGTVRVEMNAARSGFHGYDSWRNDIGGQAGLIKAGSGTLRLTGANSYRGGTRIEAGTVVTMSPCALGAGGVDLIAGSLQVSDSVQVSGYRQTGGTLSVCADRGTAVVVSGTAAIEHGSTLELRLDSSCPGHAVTVLTARRLVGVFTAIKIDRPGYRAVPQYTKTGLSVRIVRELS